MTTWEISFAQSKDAEQSSLEQSQEKAGICTRSRADFDSQRFLRTTRVPISRFFHVTSQQPRKVATHPFLLFPDDFERTFSGTDRRAIANHFTENRNVDALSPLEIDRELQAVRRSQEATYGTKELDFYAPPLAGVWKSPTIASVKRDITRDHVLKAIEEVDRNGIPPDARSTTYDLVHGQHRYAKCSRGARLVDYCSFAYSALASFRMGTSGSASFQRVRKS